MPNPTTTFVLDIGRHCNLNCQFCYHHHLGDLKKQGWVAWSALLDEVEAGIERGNNRVEITGGEPTLYPWIEELVRGLKEKRLEVCIISNGIVSGNKLKNIINCGVDEFLISIHGTEEIHNLLTAEGARQQQEKTLKILDKSNLRRRFRFNFVINSTNQENILETSWWMADWQPKIVNFINMNPLHSWAHSEETKNVIADLRIVEPQLNAAIKHLEINLIDVNVRYYPMCRIAEEYRRYVCNDLHVMFDPKEWDYCISPKTFESFRQWGINTSNSNEEKGEPCNRCDLQWICGGANKVFHRASNEIYGEVLIPQKIDGIDKDDFYYYRKNCFFEKGRA